MDARNKIFVTVGTVAILGTAGVIAALLFTKQDTATSSTTIATSQTTSSVLPSDSSSSSSSSTSSTSKSGAYKDGTYTATTSYDVPHGVSNSIKVTVTIADGKVTAVTTDNSYTDHESSEYISNFESSVSGVVVGQSIGSTSYSRIGGASLTSSAFYSALDTIATQAKA